MSGTLGTRLWPNLVHSVCIATLCWLTIDLLRLAFAHWSHRNDQPGTEGAAGRWPGWPLMIVAIVIGTVIGFSVGHELANLILGKHERGQVGGYFSGSWRQMLALLVGSLVPGTVITYYFYSRETIAAKEAAVQAAQRQAAEHQLKLLESQLEPHMLFNTLANLRVLIGVDPRRAQAMLDQLIAFLRATLAGSRAAQHPLRAEFERLADYLALMQIRMGDRLQTRFELPEALADLPVPPLLLQPLVENCIKHGLEPAVAGGRIDVSAAREGSELVLAVRDTGAGLAGGDVEGTKFGLAQVRERLTALYGARASLTLTDAADAEGGTLATIRLPIIE
ncbi:MAG: histidine kinase [Rhizobiales bacterium]|nr:histidine kinase [Rhizobacter sp.]